MFGQIIGLGLGVAGGTLSANEGPTLQQVSTLNPIQQYTFAKQLAREFGREEDAVSGLGTKATTLGDTYGQLGNYQNQQIEQSTLPAEQRMQSDLNSSLFRDKRHGQLNSLLSQRYRDSFSDNLGLNNQKMYDSERVLSSMLKRVDMQNQLDYAGQMNNLGSTLSTMDMGTQVQTPSQNPMTTISNSLNMGGAAGGMLGNLGNMFGNMGAGSAGAGMAGGFGDMASGMGGAIGGF